MNNPYAPHCNIHELKMHNPAPRPEHCLLLLHTSSSRLSPQLQSDASSQTSDLPQQCIGADAGRYYGAKPKNRDIHKSRLNTNFRYLITYKKTYRT